jgi:hypothetical protein
LRLARGSRPPRPSATTARRKSVADACRVRSPLAADSPPPLAGPRSISGNPPKQGRNPVT